MQYCRKFVVQLLAFVLFAGALVSCTNNNDVTRGTLAPKATNHLGAVIQVYSARTWGAKQALAVHTWISVKRANATYYTSYEIIGWRLKRTGTALVVRENLPDRDWWGHQPRLILDYRAEDTELLIDKIEKVIARYPYKDEYQAYPGPNSNTFIATIGREVPELGLDLPSTAIGKDYKTLGQSFGFAPSGTGIQASFLGLLGLTIAKEEGIELNILGLNFEFDIFDLALELPGVGRIGQPQVTIPTPLTSEKANGKVAPITNH